MPTLAFSFHSMVVSVLSVIAIFVLFGDNIYTCISINRRYPDFKRTNLLFKDGIFLQPWNITDISVHKTPSKVPPSTLAPTVTYQNIERKSPVGYVLATHFNDQMTGSTFNLFSLQCWVSTLPGTVKVVEPFLHHGSILGFELDPTVSTGNNRKREDPENTVKLFDVYDEKEWGKLTRDREYADLVSWKYFLKNAPRKLILVDKVCSKNSLCMACKETDFFESSLFVSSAEKFAQYYNFTVVHQACYEHIKYDATIFQDLVYGSYSPSEVVVLFNHFGGVEPHGDVLRLMTGTKKCIRINFFSMLFPLKETIFQESRQYIERFMSNVSNTGYVSIMFRTEHLSRYNDFPSMTKKEQDKKMLFCVQRIAEEVKKLKNKIRTDCVFFSTDIGKYGSAYFQKISASHFFQESVLQSGWNTNKLQQKGNMYFFQEGVMEAAMDKLHNSLFGKKVNLTARIEAVTSFHSSGYIAMLETVLAANGTCLLLVGGGHFQDRVAARHGIMHRSNCVQYLNCLK